MESLDIMKGALEKKAVKRDCHGAIEPWTSAENGRLFDGDFQLEDLSMDHLELFSTLNQML